VYEPCVGGEGEAHADDYPAKHAEVGSGPVGPGERPVRGVQLHGSSIARARNALDYLQGNGAAAAERLV